MKLFKMELPKLEFRSPPTLSWDLQKMPEIPPFTVEFEFEFRPLDYQSMRIFIDAGALKTRDEPRSLRINKQSENLRKCNTSHKEPVRRK